MIEEKKIEWNQAEILADMSTTLLYRQSQFIYLSREASRFSSDIFFSRI